MSEHAAIHSAKPNSISRLGINILAARVAT
jgi:hypothetical protein